MAKIIPIKKPPKKRVMLYLPGTTPTSFNFRPSQRTNNTVKPNVTIAAMRMSKCCDHCFGNALVNPEVTARTTAELIQKSKTRPKVYFDLRSVEPWDIR